MSNDITRFVMVLTLLLFFQEEVLTLRDCQTHTILKDYVGLHTGDCLTAGQSRNHMTQGKAWAAYPGSLHT